MEDSNNAKLNRRRLVYRRLDPFLYRRRKIRRFAIAMVTGLAIYSILIASVDRIVSLFEPDTSNVSAQLDNSKPTPLISNAFKLGHALTQMRYAESNDLQYIKWRNRAFVHIVALGLDISVMHEAIDDSKLTLDETIVLRDQIREKIRELCGVNAAATFVVGVELIPVTRAFESYLMDSEYRSHLAKGNVSILQVGSLLNMNLDEAVLPENLKIDLVDAYSATPPMESAQVKVDCIRRFREDILNFFR